MRFPAASTRATWRVVSSIAVPSASLSEATTMPSSTPGRISRGSRLPIQAVTAVTTSAVPKTVAGRARHHIMPRS